MSVQLLSGVRDLAQRFDKFIVDQFGVLLDGSSPYPGAVDAMQQLKAAGKSVLILSNSGKRSKPNEIRLQSLGFPAGCWDHFLTSGEVAWNLIQRRIAAGELKHGSKCLLIARDGDNSAIEGLGLNNTTSGAECDLLIIAGSEGDRYEIDHYKTLLEPAAARQVPCFCTNPDKVMLTPKGSRFGAGRIAELYESLGGHVVWIGKPFPEIYVEALRILGEPDREKTVCIGDSLEHDIAGGKASGLATVLVASGILAHLSDAELAAEMAQKETLPTYRIRSFNW